MDLVLTNKRIPAFRTDFKEITYGSCLYSSLAHVVNEEARKGFMSLEHIKDIKEGHLDHHDVRDGLCNFMESEDFIMKDFWVSDIFAGSASR